MTDETAGRHVRLTIGPLVGPIIGPKANRKALSVLRRLSEEWAKRTLSTRFVIVSSLVIVGTMLHIGAWVDGRIRRAVIDNAALSSARYTGHVFTDHLQELAARPALSGEAQTAIAKLLMESEFGRNVLQMKIWLPDGAIAFSLRGSKVGEKPAMTAQLLSALSGQVSSHFDDTIDAESKDERQLGSAIFEVYSPIYEKGTRRIIGVSELFEDATSLKQEFTIARQQSWIVVGSLTIGMLSLLFGIVHRGSVLILDQKKSLEFKVEVLAELLGQNEDLRTNLAAAHQESHMLSDRHLRRIGADLHDGPAQLLCFALLRLHELAPPASAKKAPESEAADPLSAIESAMQDALAQVRNISSGISVPELETLTTLETMHLAVSGHERRTKTSVEAEFGAMPEHLSLITRTCIFRGIQEGLNNAFRHAGGVGQHVSARSDNRTITIAIRDRGPGFELAALKGRTDGLGLAGLRHRVETLNGTLQISSVAGSGATVLIDLPRTG